jgi:hypothetical protein
MRELEGAQLLHAVAERIIGAYLRRDGQSEVRLNEESGLTARADRVDMTYATQTGVRAIKVKSDPYIGADPQKASDRSRSFYRPDAQVYALETIAETRQPGWLYASQADDLYYYYLAIDQTEQEVGSLFAQGDETFFTALSVAADELHILPLAGLRAWFEPRQESYPTRPVVRGGAAAWYRLVPRTDVLAGVDGVQIIGSIFGALGR